MNRLMEWKQEQTNSDHSKDRDRGVGNQVSVWMDWSQEQRSSD